MINENINGYDLAFNTNDTVFSPSSLDTGTKAMLSVIDIEKTDKVLDLGCGYGFVGIYLSKIIGEENVLMCDISSDAVTLSRENAKLNGFSSLEIIQSDGFQNIEEANFTKILSNPPYHTDFSVAKEFIENGFKHLVVNGKMIMVVKRLDWYKNKMRSIFGGVKVIEKNEYFILIAEKRSETKAKKKKENKNILSKKLRKKYEKRNKGE